MVELNQKFHIKKNGITEELTAYTTLEEVDGKGLNIKLGGQQAYLAYGLADNAEASQLNLRRPGDSTIYRILKSAKKAVPEVTLRCFDVESGTQLATVKVPVVLGSEFYLNNANAPAVNGYDFVRMDGISHVIESGNEVFNLRYVNSSVPNRTKTDWSYYYGNGGDRMNTLNMRYCESLFYGAASFKMPFNTSNVTDMSYMFYYCYSKDIPEIDTTQVTNFSNWIYKNLELTSISWPIDMRSCTSCQSMFYNTSIKEKGVKLKNVRRSLNLYGIGLNSNQYEVLNYID